MGRWLRKYGAVLSVTVQSGLAYPLDTFARCGFMAMVIFVFAEFWTTTFRLSGRPVVAGYDLPRMIWYLVLTELSTQASATLINFSTYPGSIFQGWVKLLTFTLIPAALVGYLPVELLRRFDPLVILGIVGFAVASVVLAYVVFRLGLRRYEPGSLVVLRG